MALGIDSIGQVAQETADLLESIAQLQQSGRTDKTDKIEKQAYLLIDEVEKMVAGAASGGQGRTDELLQALKAQEKTLNLSRDRPSDADGTSRLAGQIEGPQNQAGNSIAGPNTRLGPPDYRGRASAFPSGLGSGFRRGQTPPEAGDSHPFDPERVLDQLGTGLQAGGVVNPVVRVIHFLLCFRLAR